MTYTFPTTINTTNYPLTAGRSFYRTRNQPVAGIVLHVTAGLQDLDLKGTDGSAEGTVKWAIGQPVSWHAGVDSDSVRPALPASYTAWHAKGYNSSTIGIEISNRDARWDNKPAEWVTRTLRNAAKAAAAYVKAYNLPLTLATKSQVDSAISKRQKFGFTYHSYLSPGTRVDPGKTFPWARFIAMVKEELGQTSTPSVPATPGKLAVDGSFGPATARAFQTYLKKAYRSGVAVDGSWGPSSRAYLEYALNYEAKRHGWYQAPVTKTTQPGANTLHTARLRWLVGRAPVSGPWDAETTKALQRFLNARL